MLFVKRERTVGVGPARPIVLPYDPLDYAIVDFEGDLLYCEMKWHGLTPSQTLNISVYIKYSLPNLVFVQKWDTKNRKVKTTF